MQLATVDKVVDSIAGAAPAISDHLYGKQGHDIPSASIAREADFLVMAHLPNEAWHLG